MEKQRKIRLKGHESFMIRDGWLHKGILAVKENANVFSEYMGADALGVGSNMAKAIRYWLKALGLTKEIARKGTYLTKLGELILEQDSYFEDIFTLWLLHLQLVFHKEEATSWYLFFNEIKAEAFCKEELYRLMRQAMNFYAHGHSEEEYRQSRQVSGARVEAINLPYSIIGEETYSERSLESDCTVLLNMYVRQKEVNYDPEEKSISPFSILGLLQTEQKRYRKRQPEFERLHLLIVMINILMAYEEEIHSIQKSQKNQERFGIRIDDLLQKKNGPGNVLHLSKTALHFYLDKLYAGEYLELNRTAGLDMIYLKPEYLDSFAIAQSYYNKNKGEYYDEIARGNYRQ